MKKALIVTCYRYPDGDAGAVRQHSFAKIFKMLGYDVTVLSLGECTSFKPVTVDGISHISFRNKSDRFLTKVRNRLEYKKRLRNFLASNDEFEVIQFGNVSLGVIAFLKKYAKKHSIKLLHDSVEWYSPEEFTLGKLNPHYIANNLLNTKMLDKTVSVISISSYFEDYFKNRGINTVRIPVIMDVDNIPYNKNTDPKRTVFLYAGSPGKKDSVAEIVNGFALLSHEELKACELRFAGITKQSFVDLYGVPKASVLKLGDSLKCLGRVSRAEVLRELSKADFTVLLRPEALRYAKAGFPTKVVESLASATPVITNITSDLGMYLSDVQNCLLVDECSAEALAVAVKKAIEISVGEKAALCLNARAVAENCFDYKGYAENIKNLIG